MEKRKAGRKAMHPTEKRRRINLTLSPEIIDSAEEYWPKNGFKSLSDMVEVSLRNQIDRDLSDDQKIVTLPTKAHIQAAAGEPIAAEVLDWDGADDTVMVKICGLSMIPLLHDGDIIAMKHKKASRSPFMKKGLIYLVEYDGGYTVKRYNTRPASPEEKGEEWVERGKVKVLESVNPDFPEIIIKQPVEWAAWLDKKS